MPKKRILILGGSGFLGKSLISRLVKSGYEVTVVNRGITPTYHDFKTTHIIADRNDRIEYNKTLKTLSVDIILDFCAYKDIHTSDIINIFKNKIEKFIHISSASVYAQPAPDNITENWNLTSDRTDTYAHDKIKCEKVLEKYSSREFNWYSIRIPALYGAGDSSSREYAFYKAIMSNKTLLLPENGTYILQNIHINDLSDFCLNILKTKQDGGEHFNIASSTFSLHQYLIIFTRILKKRLKKEPIFLNNPIIAKTDFDCYPYFVSKSNLILDCTKAEKLHGFRTSVTLIEGLENSIKMILTNLYNNEKVQWYIPTVEQSNMER